MMVIRRIGGIATNFFERLVMYAAKEKPSVTREDQNVVIVWRTDYNAITRP